MVIAKVLKIYDRSKVKEHVTTVMEAMAAPDLEWQQTPG